MVVAVFTTAAIAPLLGLLGTVTGMINTFKVITVHGTGDPRLMAGGISEALITTQLGLAVAIPIMMMAAFLGRKAQVIAGDQASVFNDLYALLCTADPDGVDSDPFMGCQTGTIQGRLTEGDPGQEQPIPFANVLVAGTTVGTTTVTFGGLGASNVVVVDTSTITCDTPANPTAKRNMMAIGR